MKNFQPGGLRNRRPDLGGRPKSDIDNYAPKKRFNDKGGDFKRDRGGFNDRPKRDAEMFKAICTTCGKSCEVPFRPDGTKPVLCRDCYMQKSMTGTNSTTNRDRFTPNELRGRKPEPTYNAPSREAKVPAEFQTLVTQLAAVEKKVNQILELIQTSERLVAAIPETISEMESDTESSVTEKPARKPRKVAAKKVVKKAVKKSAAKKAKK